MAQHRPTPTTVSATAFIEVGAGISHRAQRSRGVLATGAAVASGALLITGLQLAGNGAATADPLTDLQNSVQQSVNQVAAPAIPGLPAELNSGIPELDKAYADWQNQAAPALPAQVVTPVDAPISSGYGSRWGAMHYGTDYAAPLGTPIRSVSNGTVIEAGPASGFGLWVRVAQADGTTAVYGHVDEIRSFVGQQVRAGDVIATVGNRGQSTGPHLHLEIWEPNGRKSDPLPYLSAHGAH
ncbi:MAG TPA: M23 family metallopeptidase [Aldersonia sp.]